MLLSTLSTIVSYDILPPITYGLTVHPVCQYKDEERRKENKRGRRKLIEKRRKIRPVYRLSRTTPSLIVPTSVLSKNYKTATVQIVQKITDRHVLAPAVPSSRYIRSLSYLQRDLKHLHLQPLLPQQLSHLFPQRVNFPPPLLAFFKKVFPCLSSLSAPPAGVRVRPLPLLF